MTDSGAWKKRLGRAIEDFAPTLAGALGGPLAGAAVESLSRAITGRDDPDPDALEKAVLGHSPEAIRAIRAAEVEFQKAVLSAQTDRLRIHAGDRADARARQVALKDITPTVLGLAVIIGFFCVLSIMLWKELPERAETEFSIMLGSLATMTAAVVNYFFGSSVGSREKTRLMCGLGQ